MVDCSGVNLFAADAGRISSGNLHCDILGEVYEILGLGNEVGLAVYFNENANLAAGVDVRYASAFSSYAAVLLGSGSHALLAEPINCLFLVAVYGSQGLFAVHHACAGSLTQVFNHCSGNLCHDLSSYKTGARDKLPYP